MDSIQVLSNARLTPLIKEIGVKGIKEIPDSVISVYNETGIKAMMQFTWRQPTYELAIPLTYLGLNTAADPVKFSYNIKLRVPEQKPRPGTIAVQLPVAIQGLADTPDPGTLYLWESTDLWGEYILAKKP